MPASSSVDPPTISPQGHTIRPISASDDILGNVSSKDRLSAAAGLFVPVSSARISVGIADQIRTAILEGKLEPGTRLPNERDLAEQFGVSRVTVRDALRTLETSGLIQIRVGATGGAFVTAPSTEVVGEGISHMLVLSKVDPDEIAEARLIMEVGTVTLAVERANEDDIAALREVCDESERAFAAGDYHTDLSRAFHAALARAAHNRAIELVAATFAGPLSMQAVRDREPAKWSHERTIEEHRALLEAIAARDTERAREIMTEHLRRGTHGVECVPPGAL
jgi:GntR family transcriptional regulator, transcriptional repressor for pyruvate dehydrogenase complex